MRRIFDWALLCAVCFTAVLMALANREKVTLFFRAVRGAAFPCSRPLLYAVGRVDPRYGVTESELAGSLRRAEEIWEKPAGRDLFEYTEDLPDLRVDLVYDGRQEAIRELKALDAGREAGLSDYGAAKARYEALSKKVSMDEAYIRMRLEAYGRREAEYVSARRSGKRVSGAERFALEADRDGIRALEKALNADIAALNSMASELNRSIDRLNMNVASYKARGEALGAFQEGVYRSEGGVKTVSVFAYSDRAQFERLLAHELAHALGLDHVPDPAAVMFPANRGQLSEVTAADLAELSRACRLR